jgi:hypothetical protein
MPAKPKATKRPTTAANAKAVAGIFREPEPPETLDFRYRRRHLETTPDHACGTVREFKYIIEVTDLEHVISTTLDRIRKRDGAKIFNEGADHLLAGLIGLAGPRGARDERWCQTRAPIVAGANCAPWHSSPAVRGWDDETTNH